MDGVLVVDKPQGLTSHDVVAVARRALDERASATPARSIRWPRASCRWRAAGPRGWCGSSSARTRTTKPTIRFGVTTDYLRRHRHETGRADRCPTREAVEAALAVAARGVSADATGVLREEGRGRRAYALARRDETVTLQAVPVRVAARRPARVLDGDSARIRRHLLGRAFTCARLPTLGRAAGYGRVPRGAAPDPQRRIHARRAAVDARATLQRPSAGSCRERVDAARAAPAEPARRVDADRGRAATGCRTGSDARAHRRLAAAAIAEQAAGVGSAARRGGRLVGARGRQTDGGFLHPAVVLI